MDVVGGFSFMTRAFSFEAAKVLVSREPEPYAGFFKKYHPDYIAEKVSSWSRRRDKYKNFFKRLVDDVYHDDFREFVFTILGEKFYPTDR